MKIYFVVLISALSQIGFSGSRVAVSLHALQLSANEFAIGVVIALYSLCPMLLSIVIGRFADRTPPHLPVILGSAVMTAAMILPFVSPGIGMLCVTAFVLGLAHQVFSIPLEAVVGGIDGEKKRARNYAFITMGWSGANFIGPLVAGFTIDYVGQLEVYLVLSVLTAVPILILLLKRDLFPRTAVAHAAAEARGSVLDLWRIPSVRMTIIAAGVVGSAQDLFQFYLPIYAHSVGLSASAIGTILGLVFAAAFVIRSLLPLLVKRLKEATILIAAMFIAAVAYTLLPFFSSAYALGTIAFLLGLGVGCAQPMTMSLLYVLTPPGRIAESFGLQKTVRNATHLVVPILFGSLGAAFGVTAVFLSNSAILGVSGLLMRKAGIPESAGRASRDVTGG
jgi:predicted MFS family arabinose efflux permease